MSVTLREITPDNWRVIGKLLVADDQTDFVAPNDYSLLQAAYDEPKHELVPLGVYNDETPVGFIMYGRIEHGDQWVWAIWRLMVDVQYQRKDYGRAALGKTIEKIRAEHGCDEIFISFLPDNISARTLYEAEGFEDTGEIDDGEIVYRLDLING